MIANETVEQRIWKPISREQERFLSSSADEALFGGAAGPGKTECLLMEALRQIYHPRYNAVIFRRTYPMLEGADGIISRSHNWYPAYGGRYNEAKHFWKFPSGSRIYFAHLEHEDDVFIYQGWQITYIGFDELTQFLESQYLYMFSRNRADEGSGLRCYLRSATNPGGIGHKWVKRRFITSGILNTLGYFTRINDVDTRVDKTHIDAKSRVFIPALYDSNPKLSRSYLSNLKQLSPTEQAQLIGGDWDAENISGRIYPDWSSTHNVTLEAEYDPNYPVFFSVDDGYTDQRVIGLWQIRYAQGKPDRLCLFNEVVHTHKIAFESLKQALEYAHVIFDKPLDKLTIEDVQIAVARAGHLDFFYYDPSAVSFSAEAQNLGLSTWAGYNKVDEGIKTVRRFILDGNGERRLLVHPRCEVTIDAMGMYNSKEKSTDGNDPKPVHDIFSHPADMVRYFIATRYLTND